jgi:hypothetical protein
MAESNPPDGPDDPADAADLKALARDWITIWHSEMAASAQDREAQELWQAMATGWADAWAAAATTMVDALPDVRPTPRASPAPHEPGGARPVATPRPPPADAAFDPRDAEVERLARRVADLERRLAERDGAGDDGPLGRPLGSGGR